VSFYNESPQGSVDHHPWSPCVGIMKDFSKAITMELKAPGDKLYLIGRDLTTGRLRVLQTMFGSWENVPVVRFDLERSMIYAVIDAIDEGLLAAAHDISNGGLAATVMEMALVRPRKAIRSGSGQGPLRRSQYENRQICSSLSPPVLSWRRNPERRPGWRASAELWTRAMQIGQ